mmetsp:Transcript_99277/g.258861  ORF Transcript_99277/g.258861 Transcript_99277/m.258861 type:complete len:202 (+) Transcript_99277:210-815(+)
MTLALLEGEAHLAVGPGPILVVGLARLAGVDLALPSLGLAVAALLPVALRLALAVAALPRLALLLLPGPLGGGLPRDLRLHGPLVPRPLRGRAGDLEFEHLRLVAEIGADVAIAPRRLRKLHEDLEALHLLVHGGAQDALLRGVDDVSEHAQGQQLLHARDAKQLQVERLLEVLLVVELQVVQVHPLPLGVVDVLAERVCH